MIPHPGGRPPLPIDEADVIASYQIGRSESEIARDLGVDRSRVTRVLDLRKQYLDQTQGASA